MAAVASAPPLPPVGAPMGLPFGFDDEVEEAHARLAAVSPQRRSGTVEAVRNRCNRFEHATSHLVRPSASEPR